MQALNRVKGRHRRAGRLGSAPAYTRPTTFFCICHPRKAPHLDEAVDAAGDQHGAVGAERRRLGVRLGPKRDARRELGRAGAGGAHAQGQIQRSGKGVRARPWPLLITQHPQPSCLASPLPPPTTTTTTSPRPNHLRGVRLDLVARAVGGAAEQIKRSARRQQALRLLPAGGGREGAAGAGRGQGAAGVSGRGRGRRPAICHGEAHAKPTGTRFHPSLRGPPPHHLSACPTSAMSRDGGTITTSWLSACASAPRRLSFEVPP
jgi:hypothetical protein